MSDALPPNPPVAVAAAVVEPAAPARGRNVVCEFCQSKLAPDGSYLEMGERAKELRKASEKIDALKTEIARLEAECNTLRSERDAAVAAATREQQSESSDRY